MLHSVVLSGLTILSNMALKICIGVFLLPLCISLSVSPNGEKDKEKICDVPCKEGPMEVTFVIDSSSSMWPNNFTKALWFVGDFIDIFKIGSDGIRVAAVTYGDRVYTEDAFGLDAYTAKHELKNAVSGLPYKGGSSTETGAGIRYMRENFLSAARSGVKKICIVLTDGNSQRGDVTAEEARLTREEGVQMFAVGIGRDISEKELRNIAGDDNHVFLVTSYNLLGTIRARLAYEICGEQPPWPVVCYDNPIDISLVIDASSSIGDKNFSIGLDFLKDFVKSFDISPQRALFSAITYGFRTYDNTAFNFNTYTEETSLVDAIANIPYTAGNYTDTGLGIQFMREKQMIPYSRPHAAHVAVILTDGNSQDWSMTEEEAALSREGGISMFAIGVGMDISDDELLKIAGQQDHVFKANEYKALETIKEMLDIQICTVALEEFNHPPNLLSRRPS